MPIEPVSAALGIGGSIISGIIGGAAAKRAKRLPWIILRTSLMWNAFMLTDQEKSVCQECPGLEL